eukprot:SAG11_NODE_1916_length_4071_cov_3.418429_8_plen_201_part_00
MASTRNRSAPDLPAKLKHKTAAGPTMPVSYVHRLLLALRHLICGEQPADAVTMTALTEPADAILVLGGEHIREHFGALLAAVRNLPLFVSSGNYRQRAAFDPARNAALRHYVDSVHASDGVNRGCDGAVACAAVPVDWEALSQRLVLDRSAIDTVGNFVSPVSSSACRCVHPFLPSTGRLFDTGVGQCRPLWCRCCVSAA